MIRFSVSEAMLSERTFKGEFGSSICSCKGVTNPSAERTNKHDKASPSLPEMGQDSLGQSQCTKDISIELCLNLLVTVMV